MLRLLQQLASMNVPSVKTAAGAIANVAPAGGRVDRGPWHWERRSDRKSLPAWSSRRRTVVVFSALDDATRPSGSTAEPK